MARRVDSKSEPNIEFDPRHRIVGAIILVSLTVILLPLILDESSPEASGTSSGTGSVAMASAPSELVGRQLPVKKTITQKKSATPTVVANSESTPKTKIIIKKVLRNKPSDKSNKPVKLSPKKIAAAPATKSTASKTKKASLPTKSTSDKTRLASKARSISKPRSILKPHWAVQVGTFSNPGNVRRLGKQLKERGYSVLLKDVNLKQGSAVRVRVGPYRSRASADRAQGKIIKDIGLKGVVVAGP